MSSGDGDDEDLSTPVRVFLMLFLKIFFLKSFDDEIDVQAYLTLYFNPNAHSYLLSHSKLQKECEFF